VRENEALVLEKYADIIDLPAPTSTRHARMGRDIRAAQFAPFAALVGHGAAIAEVGRVTEQRIELEEGEREAIDLTLTEALARGLFLTVTYFVPDARKSGGEYVTVEGVPIRYDDYTRTLTVLSDFREITFPIGDVLSAIPVSVKE